ncbi:uncharacterized protein Cda5 [Planococcus citri]|uniref:uncharacterized protein Cda5 n=1 Tax=Planococcus citri TaxID=170843 RepID=UPI0031F9DBA0
MSPEAMFNLHNGFLLLTCGLFSLIVPFGWAQQRNNKPDEFSCPEEFGYYPHPTDCTQYYVCVFGGALLESCTGGLMYSHDLQTCDWPRNVGCGASPASAANSLNTVSTASGSGPELGSRYTTPSWKHEIPQPQQDEIPDRHLYEEEDLGPVEEIESDRQQRVYRGQPPTLGQVARDRDGIVRHANALQTSAGPEKIKPVAVVSFGSHHQSLRPPPSVPPYIIEQHSVPSVPTTPKSVYNLTKFEPYYNVYDDEAEIYRDIDYGQYNQRKQQDSYQVIQEPHRLQPIQPQSQPSQILTNPPSYNNQDYKLQSDIDGDTQQSEKLPSTRLFLGHNETSTTLSRLENNKPIEYFPFIRSAFSPVVDLTNNNKQLKLTASFQLGNPINGVHRNATVNNFKPIDLPYETIRSYELNFRNDDDSIIGETSQLPAKINSFTRKYQPFNISSTTIRIPKATTASPIRNFKTPSIRDNFRIIVEPINSKKPLPPIAFTAKPTPSAGNTIFTYKMPSTDKFSATYRSLANVLSTTYTPYSIIQLQTTTTTTTTTSKPVLSSVSPDSEKQTSNANSRRFYIPRNDLIERKLSLSSITTTNSPTIPKTDSIKPTTKQFNVPNNNDSHRIAHSTTPSTLLTQNNNKEGEENEILYYDDEYYDEGETPENDDNYIDNKISNEVSTSTYSNDVPKPKPSTPTKPKLTKVPFSSTSSINVPKSPLRIPNESSTNSLKVEAETKRPHRYKESYSERCPQCNEKPSGRGRNRGSVTYTTGGNEYEATPAGGRTRPTLKPSTSIVSKASESIDIYRFAPKRPDTVYPTPQVDKVAAKCRKDICLLPDCSCGGKDIPGDLRVEDTPQLVLLTFDDSVNELNRGLYTDLFEKGRTNPNGCPISATFYVSHEWTDYSMVQNLYAAGHEIASHSVSHSFGEQFSQRKWTKEIVGQREILSAYGGVKQEDIRGMRAPFLAVGGNKMFKMLYDANFTYDSSMPIYENRPPSWPYTLDYKIFHDCMIPPCPTRSYPGVWEVPMVMWQDLNGGRCSMGDACSNPPDSDGVYKMLIKNFERHFTTNRAPFGLFYHSSWFTQPHHKEGFIAFLDTIVNMPEVWLVTNWQAIQWARDPTPISRLNNFTPFNCDYPDRPRRCNNAKVCNLWHKSGVRYLKTCQPCPDVYPWTGKTGVRNSRVDNDDTLVE